MTEKVGLLGWPVEHSISPPMHNTAFAALGLDWHYDLLPVEPAKLADGVTKLLDEGYRGFNVTIPHKLAVLDLPQVAAVDPAVEAIGAANTLILENGSLQAINTDWLGFIADLKTHDVAVDGKFCLVLGTGGASKAVAYALRQMGASAVKHATIEPLRDENDFPYDQLADYAPQAGLIVHCTSLGMWPKVDASVWPENVPFPTGAVLYDVVYTPPVTRLMEQASRAGLRTIGGLGMLVRQGAFSFAKWTGFTPPFKVMADSARRALGIG
jgi:shikimate dehydrogenase